MVTQIPELHELVSLFESEPVLLDRDQPWFYNSLRWELRRGAQQISVEMEPSDGQISVVLSEAGRELLVLRVTATGFSIDSRDQSEWLVLHMPERTGLGDIRVRTRPDLHVVCAEW